MAHTLDLRPQVAATDRAPFGHGRITMASAVGDSSGISTLLVAWSAAVYVAQIEDGHMTGALAAARDLDVT